MRFRVSDGPMMFGRWQRGPRPGPRSLARPRTRVVIVGSWGPLRALFRKSSNVRVWAATVTQPGDHRQFLHPVDQRPARRRQRRDMNGQPRGGRQSAWACARIFSA